MGGGAGPAPASGLPDCDWGEEYKTGLLLSCRRGYWFGAGGEGRCCSLRGGGSGAVEGW